MRTTTTVIIAESTQMYCDLLIQAFKSARHRFRVVSSATNTTGVLAALNEFRPRVAVISSDLADGPLSGVKLLPVIKNSFPETRTLVVMESPHRELVIDAFRNGAVGVFSRNGPFQQLRKAVDVVAQGQIWASSIELHYVLNAFAKSPPQPKLDSTVEGRITKREAAVVRLAIEGLSNREIARELTLTEHTVKNYLFRVFDKLGVSNRVELVLACLHQEEMEKNEEMRAAPRKVLTVKRRAEGIG